MSIESHLVELQRRHAVLDKAIKEAMHHPSADPLEIKDLKRRKLLLKDEIARLKDGDNLH